MGLESFLDCWAGCNEGVPQQVRHCQQQAWHGGAWALPQRATGLPGTVRGVSLCRRGATGLVCRSAGCFPGLPINTCPV